MDQDPCSDYWISPGVRNTLMSLLIAEVTTVVFLSILLVVGLSIPLLIQLKNGSFDQNVTDSRRRRQREPPYSTYNLYLVYLALIDLAYSLPTIVAYWFSATRKFVPQFYAEVLIPQSDDIVLDVEVKRTDHMLIGPYVLANMWLNAIIAYQVFILLRQTHCAQRITQPTLARVNLQGGGILFGFILLVVLSSVAESSFNNNEFDDTDSSDQDEIETGEMIVGILLLLVGAFLYLCPIIYVIVVTILVKRRGYIPSTSGSSAPRDRAIRGLAFYFFRITIVFLAIWLPFLMFSNLTIHLFPLNEVAGGQFCYGNGAQLWVFFMFHILLNIQPILTFCMILTKHDVKKYIKDLVTLSYLFGDSKRDDKKILVGANKTVAKETTDDTDPETLNESPPWSNRISILGFSFEDIDVTIDADADAENNGDDNGDVAADAEQDVDVVSTIGVSDNDDAPMVDEDYDEEEVSRNDFDANIVEGDSNVNVDDETGNQKYKSRRISGIPATAVLATGQAYHMLLKQGQAKKL